MKVYIVKVCDEYIYNVYENKAMAESWKRYLLERYIRNYGFDYDYYVDVEEYEVIEWNM